MKKMFCMFLCMVMFVSMTGCGKDKEPEKKKEEKKTETVSETKTVTGRIVDATSTRFSIVNDSNVTYNFDRSKMELEGESLLVDEVIKVTYVNEKGNKIAKKGVIIKQSDAPIDHIQSMDDIIAHMSVEEKVGQMFFVRCPNDQAVPDVNTYHLGGYVLFDKDFRNQSFQQVVDTIASYQSQANVPLLVAVDEEGGTVNRVSNYTAFRAVPFWAPQALYAQGGFDLVRSDVKDKAQLLKSLGINVNLAPVADVSTDPNNFIYQRSFGRNAQETANYVDVVVREMNANGIGSTLKHFPGYGNNVDTHTGISIDKRSYDNFVNNDFLPFQAGIAAGVGSVLVSHNIINSMDGDHPASLSPRVHEILRNDLNFSGVIMSDDLSMDAIKQYTDENAAAVAAVKAGNDLLVCDDYRVQLPAVIEAVQNKEISEDQLNESVRRILQWKIDLGLLEIK